MGKCQPRQKFELTKEEKDFLDYLNQTAYLWPTGTRVWKFWGEVAQARGLDVKTIICTPWVGFGTFTGLEIDYNGVWCYPFRIKCRQTPNEVIASQQKMYQKNEVRRAAKEAWEGVSAPPI
jgi:hypothetical protein